MEVAFRRSFTKDLKGKDPLILKRLKSILEKLETIDTLDEITNIKQLKIGEGYYRIRIGDYRLGFKLENNALIITRFIHRNDFYRYFP